MSQKQTHNTQDVETTGHSWDGIEEYNNPLPRWWLWVFYACIVWGIAYTVLYPAWPLIDKATPGVLGKSTRADVAQEILQFKEANAAIEQKIVDANLDAIAQDADMNSYAQNAGQAIFQTWCSQCHGSGAAGAQGLGYPNLTDDDWLWGGDIEAIHTTISHGIRDAVDNGTRYSEMPVFGDILEGQEIDQLVQYVRQISGHEHDAALAESGATVFADNCVSCHMEDGTGDKTQGAPNLTDAIWLYGSDEDTLRTTITNSRFGVMPSWAEKLSEAEIRSVSTYIHSLGGGE